MYGPFFERSGAEHTAFRMKIKEKRPALQGVFLFGR
jgi:hypothetical protein